MQFVLDDECRWPSFVPSGFIDTEDASRTGAPSEHRELVDGPDQQIGGRSRTSSSMTTMGSGSLPEPGRPPNSQFLSLQR